MPKEKKNGNSIVKKFLNAYRTEKRSVFVVYVVLRFLVLAALVLSCIGGNWENAFICLLVLVLFLLPLLFEASFHVELPSTLQIVILIFIFAAEILGELQSYFVRYEHWDTVLHTTWGFLCAAVGYSLVDILNRNKRIRFSLSPIYLALVAFCFSMTIGVLWEFFEFGMDYFFHKDMQKDTIIHAFSSVTLDPTRSNIPIRVEGITDVAVNGESLGLGGYLDIGLYDTMEDLFVNFLGAIVFSLLGFLDAKTGGKLKLVSRFVPQVPEDPETPENA